MCVFIIFTVICIIHIPDIRGLTADQSLKCTSELIFPSSSPEGQNTSLPSGVQILVQFGNFQTANQSSNISNIQYNNSKWPLDRLHGNRICISLNSTFQYGASRDNVDLPCYIKPYVPASSVAPRLLYNVTPPKLQLSISGGEWVSVCKHEVDDFPSNTMGMICEELGYGVANWTLAWHDEYNQDSGIKLKCPNNSSRLTDCQPERGPCQSHRFIRLTCHIENDESRGFTWSIITISLVSTAAGLLFLLLLSLIAHFCRCCTRRGPSEVLVTYVKKNKTSFRNQYTGKQRPANSSLLLQLPSLSQENLDVKKTVDRSTRGKDFMGSSERIYFDIADTPVVRSTIEVGDQSYQVDEDGYAKPRDVTGNVLVKSPVARTLDAKAVTSRPITSPKPKSVSKPVR